MDQDAKVQPVRFDVAGLAVQAATFPKLPSQPLPFPRRARLLSELAAQVVQHRRRTQQTATQEPTAEYRSSVCQAASRCSSLQAEPEH